jgi:hypothetical protein
MLVTRLCVGPSRDRDCPAGTLVTIRQGSHQSPRCPPCKAAKANASRPATRARDARRGTRQQRGYDAEHDQIRAMLIATYHPTDPCWRCLEPLGPDPSVLDLGHTDDRTGYQGLEHAACNRGARAQRSSRLG